jgi:hypothetical protein
MVLGRDAEETEMTGRALRAGVVPPPIQRDVRWPAPSEPHPRLTVPGRHRNLFPHLQGLTPDDARRQRSGQLCAQRLREVVPDVVRSPALRDGMGILSSGPQKNPRPIGVGLLIAGKARAEWWHVWCFSTVGFRFGAARS